MAALSVVDEIDWRVRGAATRGVTALHVRAGFGEKTVPRSGKPNRAAVHVASFAALPPNYLSDRP
jgi:hypothetical protein